MTAPWIAIALSRDVPPGATRPVRLEGEELVIWRADSGGPAHVWEDRCPHRGMRLSLGFVRDGALNCLYHGWQYGPAASCLRIPAHPDLLVPPTIRANAFEAAELGGLVFVRRGGDEAALPLLETAQPVASVSVDADHPGHVAGEHAFENGRLHIHWHRAGPGRIMLHAVLTGSADTRRAAAFLRGLRDQLEQEVAA